ncbi:MAG: STAS domain-containing protein, partial [Solirubrobacteraceae bacterium]
TFIDVTGLVVLLELDAERERHGGTLTLIRGNAHVHRLFELAGASDRLRLVGAPLSELLH